MGAIALGIAVALLWSWLADDNAKRFLVKLVVLPLVFFAVFELSPVGKWVMYTFMSLTGGEQR